VIVAILIVKRNPVHPLAYKGHDLVRDQVLPLLVVKIARKRSIIPIARSAALSSNAPASEVMTPASNASSTMQHARRTST
jgi:hypothetical protein